jgi:putative transposase
MVFGSKEDCDAEEELQAGRDRREVAAGCCADVARQERGRGDPLDRLHITAGVRSSGLKSDQVKRLKELETENTRLRRAVSDLTLDKLILQEAARGNY